MLTRDGERVLEILLIAAGLALTVMFQNSLPGGQALPENQGGRLEEPGFVQQVHGLDLDEPRQAPASTLAAAVAGIVSAAMPLSNTIHHKPASNGKSLAGSS